jgi:ABC-type transporter Mla subunit MlaD
MRLQLRRARVSAVIVAVGGALAVACAVVLLSQLSGGSPLGDKTTLRVAVDSAKGGSPTPTWTATTRS